MRPSYLFPATVIGGAIGWQSLKAFLLPLVVWSSTAAGGAVYVNWVIKSHNANVIQSGSGTGAKQGGGGEMRVAQFIDDLVDLVSTREDFIATYGSVDTKTIDISQQVEALRVEDTKVFAEMDQLKSRSPGAYTNDIALKAARLKILDGQLKALADKAAN